MHSRHALSIFARQRLQRAVPPVTFRISAARVRNGRNGKVPEAPMLTDDQSAKLLYAPVSFAYALLFALRRAGFRYRSLCFRVRHPLS
jgi:hypothetical protein